MKGIVFDIQRFALHDGPGIRTTVFLKGCPMQCLWCHNPESQSPHPQLSYNEERCTNCLSCVDACPHGAHLSLNEKHRWLSEKCGQAFRCVDACLYGALKKTGYETDAHSVMEEVVRDKTYYTASGGGLTISGGEPMVQPLFTLELLQLAQSAGIHTAIDTCGFSKRENYTKVLPYTNLFLFDYKITDPKKHLEFTGVSNELIISNFDYIYSAGNDIIVRCPIIPGINDDDGHFSGIANFSKKYPRVIAFELMAYHNLGDAKIKHYQLSIKPLSLPTVNDDEKQTWVKKLQDLGVSNARVG